MTRVSREQLEMFLREASEAISEAKRLVRRDFETFMASLEARYALRYALIAFVEAVTDAITLVLEADHGVAPDSYREAVLLAAEKGIIPYSLAERLVKLVSLRNMLVHRYWRIDDARLYRETRENVTYAKSILEALKKYVETIDP
ncbi:DUF86 domain-containing protein [Pyrofollis japonicus]|uniref:type VII toxin-antitoxin system HepT family RNase toxin n=1 Tax=Pyrofollis japonicus TaxID=3060460 RepID=UPI00295B700B|nr:HepT-like ribonuclease domain-containing protein [Pyrofollis japonicus]BEP17243.1 DUF86 domain-containing protein [Pyrofollis japonicus]